MYPVLKIMHMLNFLDTFSMSVTIRHHSNPKISVIGCPTAKILIKFKSDAIHHPRNTSGKMC